MPDVPKDSADNSKEESSKRPPNSADHARDEAFEAEKAASIAKSSAPKGTAPDPNSAAPGEAAQRALASFESIDENVATTELAQPADFSEYFAPDPDPGYKAVTQQGSFTGTDRQFGTYEAPPMTLQEKLVSSDETALGNDETTPGNDDTSRPLTAETDHDDGRPTGAEAGEPGVHESGTDAGSAQPSAPSQGTETPGAQQGTSEASKYLQTSDGSSPVSEALGSHAHDGINSAMQDPSVGQ
jgi:hypothetical protein